MSSNVIVNENGDATTVVVADTPSPVVALSPTTQTVNVSTGSNNIVVSANLTAAKVFVDPTVQNIVVPTTTNLVNVTSDAINAADVAYRSVDQTFTGANVFSIGSVSKVPVTIKGANGQSTDLFRIQTYLGADLIRVFPTGVMQFVPGQFTLPSNINASTSSTGASDLLSRADHKHDVDTAAAVTISATTVNAAGSASTLSRSDHLHTITANVAPSNVIVQTAAVGTSAALARADHLHNVVSGLPVAIQAGDTQSAGSATSLALSDHRHPVTSANPVALGSTSQGSASTIARSDHIHPTTGLGVLAAANTWTTTNSFTGGGGTLQVTAGPTADHVYIEYYADSQALTTRSAWIGYGSSGDTTFAINNAMGGNIVLTSGGNLLYNGTQVGVLTTVTPSGVASSSSVGSAVTTARADHVHSHTSANHSVGTEIAAGTPGSSAPNDVAAQGSATSVARSDHVHGRESWGTGSPSALGSAAAGTAITLSRFDHIHPTTNLALLDAANGFTNGSGQQMVKLGVGTSPVSASQMIVIPGTISTVGQVIKRLSGQTGNLAEFQDENGTVMTTVKADGGIVLPYNIALQSEHSGGVLANRTNLISRGTSNEIFIGGGADVHLRGSTTLYFGNTSTDVVRLTSTTLEPITASGASLGESSLPWSQLYLKASGLSIVPLTISGATSQSGNLTEWQTATGGVITSVTSAGFFNFVSSQFAAPISSAVGDTQSAGTAATVARSDHKHAREAFGSVTSQTTFGSSASNGSAATIARSDHTHGNPTHISSDHSAANIPTASPGSSSPGDAIAAGTSTSLARADHVHSREAWSTSTGLQLGPAAIGSSNTIARADHIHPNSILLVSDIVGFLIKGSISQSVNLSEWRDTSNVLLASISSTGSATFASVTSGGSSVITASSHTSTSHTISYILPFAKEGNLIVAQGKGRMRFPYAVTIQGVTAAINTAPTGTPVILDLNKNGTTMFTTQANRPSIATSAFATASEVVPDITAVASGDYLTVDFDQVGSGISGADITVFVRYTRVHTTV